MITVLIVDDEAAIRRFLRLSLAAEGFAVLEAATVHEALTLCRQQHPQLVVLDLGLPDGDGSQVLSAIRRDHDWPVLVLSVREDEAEKVRLLDAGANDYMTKPFGIQEFMARVRVLLRQQLRLTKGGQLRFASSDLELDLPSQTLRHQGRDIRLSKKEFAFLVELLRHPGQVLTQQQLLVAVWGPSHKDDNHYLRIVVANLRRKLGDDAEQPALIETLPGIGYRFMG